MGYIFESEISVIMNTVRSRTIGESETIKLREVLRADIHPAIKAYVKAEVEKILQDERTLEQRSKKMPYSLREVASLQHQIDVLLVNNYSFGQQEFEALLDESVHFQFNFLCRPQWTLLNFIYGNQRRASTSDVERKLRYCVDYTYFSDLVKRYVVERGLAEVSYEEFKTLLEKIDREVVAQHSSLELARMTRALFSFIDSGKQGPHDEFEKPKLPINAAVVFFEDKQLQAIKERLERERDVNKIQEVTVSELATIIEKVRTGNEEAKVEASIHDFLPNLARQEEKNVRLDNIVVVMDEVEKAPIRPESEVSDGSPSIPMNHVTSSEGEDRSMNLYEEISAADQKLYVRKLFHRDENEFLKAVDELSKCKSWQEASHYLDRLFMAKNVDPFSKEAVQFTDVVFSRYQSPTQ